MSALSKTIGDQLSGNRKALILTRESLTLLVQSIKKFTATPQQGAS